MIYKIVRDLQQLSREFELKKKECMEKKEKYALGDAWYGKAMGYDDAIEQINKLVKKYGERCDER